MEEILLKHPGAVFFLASNSQVVREYFNLVFGDRVQQYRPTAQFVHHTGLAGDDVDSIARFNRSSTYVAPHAVVGASQSAA